jgi:hypothetical protein
MGDERYAKMALQARTRGRDPKEEPDRLGKKVYGRF